MTRIGGWSGDGFSAVMTCGLVLMRLSMDRERQATVTYGCTDENASEWILRVW